MNEKINTFLNSGLLDKYLLGETTSAEAEMVESFIIRYPEIENTYNMMQHNLEVVAKVNAVEAPKNILNNILDELDETPVIKLNKTKSRKKWYAFSVAASIAALIFAGSSTYYYNQNQKLKSDTVVVDAEIDDLRNDIAQNNAMLDKVMRQLLKLNNPETEKYIIKGNERAKDLKTVAYINPKEKTSMIDIVSLPELPDEQCYQIWAELQGKMVNLGILDKADRQLRSIPYMEDALALSITIETKGANAIASTNKAVAEISLH
ncbi:anti-sigma factor domain-containing protein [Algibacter sp.]|uniref:anti-sigma factor domain-containing protein n=1 Tax=Algibacter sp. TaxID=1872428 RepID=UPI003C70BA6B